MRNAFLAASAAALLLAAGCGGDDDSDSIATQPAASDGTAAVPPSTAATMSESTGGAMSDTTAASAGTEVGTIPEVAASAGTFSTLLEAVEAAGLSETLSGEGPFTVFAPTDEAFAALPEGTLDALLADPAALARILTYHVVGGEVLAAEVVGLTEAGTLEGAPISVAVEGDTVVLNDSVRVLQTDIAASNGVIHVIDSVLLPPEV